MELSIDRGEVLRYLGYRKGQSLRGVEPLLEQAEQILRVTAVPRWVTGSFDLEKGPCGIGVAGTTLILTGRDIAAHLNQASRCILLGATLGGEVERKLAQLQRTDMALALVLDACATTGIESLCDQVEEGLRVRLLERGENLTFRFSPGYGDLPIELQPGFLEALNAGRTIGLQVTASNILTPRKSVTAVMGVLPQGVRGPSKGCTNCANFANCPYRKDGITCGF